MDLYGSKAYYLSKIIEKFKAMHDGESVSDCELCTTPGGDILWQDGQCRVVLVVVGAESVDYPGFCRVIWTAHVREMTDLRGDEQRHLMNVVFAVEAALRKVVQPDKINLASLGNVVPHLHWHVIPRFVDDCNFPAPIWAERRQSALTVRHGVARDALRDAFIAALSNQQGGDVR